MSNQKIDYSVELDIINPLASPIRCYVGDVRGVSLEEYEVASIKGIFYPYLMAPRELENKTDMDCLYPIKLKDPRKKAESGGWIDHSNSNIAYRTIISLDFDGIEESDWEYVKTRLKAFRFPYLWHTTYSHCTHEDPLGYYRVYIPFKISPGNCAYYRDSERGKTIYSYFNNFVFQRNIGECFDKSSFEVGKKMFLPCVPPGFAGKFSWGYEEGREIVSLKDKFGAEGGRHNVLTARAINLRTKELKTTEQISDELYTFINDASDEYKDMSDAEIEAILVWVDGKCPIEVAKENVEKGLTAGPDGKKKKIERNVAWCRAELAEMEFDYHYDKFLGKEVYKGSPIQRDGQLINIFADLEEQYRDKGGWVSKAVFLDAVEGYAEMRARDCLVEELEKCKQEYLDYIARNDDYIGLIDVPEKVLGCRDLEDVQRLFFMKWMMGGALRGIKPGAQVDSMLILVGGQGVGKTSFFRFLALKPDWYQPGVADFSGRNKDDLLKTLGKQVVLVDEINKHFTKKEDAELKNFLTNTVDSIRQPFGRKTGEYHRRFVFGGCSNEEGMFRDKTGNRRYWVLEVGRIDVEAVMRFKRLWWGEAVCRVENGEKHWFDTYELEEQVANVTAKYQEDDFLEEQIVDYINTPEAQSLLEKRKLKMKDVVMAIGYKSSYVQPIGRILRGKCGLVSIRRDDARFWIKKEGK